MEELDSREVGHKIGFGFALLQNERHFVTVRLVEKLPQIEQTKITQRVFCVTVGAVEISGHLMLRHRKDGISMERRCNRAEKAMEIL